MTDADDSTQRDHLALIGQIIVAWSTTEELCDVTLAGLLGINQRLSQSITTPVISFYVRSEIMKSVAKQTLNEETFKEFESVISKLRGAYKMRNLIAHGYWVGLNLEEPLLQQKKTDLAPEVRTETFSKKKLTKILKQVGEAQNSIALFAVKHDLIPTYDQAKQAPLPDKP